MDKYSRIISFLIVMASFAGVGNSALADPGTLALGLKTEYSDNARKSSTNQVDDFKNTASIAIDKRDRFGRLDSYLVGDIEFYSYANDTFSSNIDSNLLWDASYHIRPRTLTWDIANEIGEVRIDSSEADTPDNRTTRNIFSTGPSYIWNLSKVDFANLAAEYQRVDYKTDGDDNDRFRLISSITHLLSDRQQISASYNWTKTLFGSERELYRNEIFGSYRYNYLHYFFDGSYGVTHLKGRIGTTTEETDSNTWNVTLRAQTSRTSNVGITYNRELNDTASGFDRLYDNATINLTETSVVLLTEWSVFYQKTFSNASSLDSKIFHNISDYLIGNTDEERNGISLDYRYPLYTRLTLGIHGEYQKVDFTPSNREDDEYEVSIGTDYEYIRNLFFSVELTHELQESNSPTHEYDENRLIVGVRYLPTF